MAGIVREQILWSTFLRFLPFYTQDQDLEELGDGLVVKKVGLDDSVCAA